MRGLWPDESLEDVFSTKNDDPYPREPIKDKYGLVFYGPRTSGGMGVCAYTELPSLGVSATQFLALIDPEESERVARAIRQRSRLRSDKYPGAPVWLIAPRSLV